MDINPREPVSLPTGEIVVPPPPKQGPVPGLRQLYPELHDLSDDELLKGVHKVDFSDLSDVEFMRGLAKTYPVKAEPHPVVQIAQRLLGQRPEAPAFNMEKAPQAARMAVGIPLAAINAVTNFGKGLADVAAGEDTPEAQNAKDVVMALPRGLMKDAKAANTFLWGVTNVLPKDIRDRLPESARPTPQQVMEAAPQGLAFLTSTMTGLKAEQMAADYTKDLISRAAIAGGTYGGTYEAVLAGLKGEPIDKVAEKAATGTAVGMAAGPILHVAGEAAGTAAAPFTDQMKVWMGGDGTTQPWHTKVPPDAPGASRVGVPYAPATEPHPVNLPEAPVQTALAPTGTGAAPVEVPVTPQPLEPPAGQFPDLAPTPGEMPGQVPGLMQNTAQALQAAPGTPGAAPGYQTIGERQIAPEVTPADLTSPLEQPRPTQPLGLEPTAIQPGVPPQDLSQGPPSAAVQTNAQAITPEAAPTAPATVARDPNDLGGQLQAIREGQIKQTFRPAAFTAPEVDAAAQVAPTPAGPGRWREYATLADENIAAAKTRLATSRQQKVLQGLLTEDAGWASLLKGEGGYIDPADVRDMAIIAANHIVKVGANLAAVTEQLVREFGEEIRPYAERIFNEGQALFNARRARGNDSVRITANNYADGIGLRTVPMPSVHERFDPELGRKVADAYDALPTMDPAAKLAYNYFKQEIEEQYQAAVAAGYKFTFEDGEPYAGDSGALMRDVRENRTVRSQRTPEGLHPYLSAEENDKFRAIHDLFGHAKEGYSFGPDGEYNAWRAHARMFSNKAIPAMTTETMGQNAWVNFGKHITDQSVPLRDRPFAPQKAALLPEWVYKDVLHSGPKPGLAAGRPTVKTVGTPLTDVAAKLAKGVKPVVTPEGARARAEADVMANVRDYAAANPAAANWYHNDVDVFKQNVQKEFPQTQDPARMAWYMLETAVTSPQKKMLMNVDVASRMEDAFNRTGKVPVLARLGQEFHINRGGMRQMNALLDEFHHNLSDIQMFLTSKNANGDYAAVDIFGPKVGRFWLNLMGVHDEVTVDVWMARWWHRVMGQPFDKKGAMIDAPVNDKEAENIRTTIQGLADQLGMAPDALQAVIWDREKKLWRDNGLRDPDDLSFAGASQHVFQKRAEARGEAIRKLGEGAPQGNVVRPAKGGGTEVMTPEQKQHDTILSMADVGAHRAASGPELDVAWATPNGKRIPVFNKTHEQVASKVLASAKVKNIPPIIGNNLGAHQTFLNHGFVRLVVDHRGVLVEITAAPSEAQRRLMGQLVQKHGFLGGQVITPEGEFGEYNDTWGSFLRSIEALPRPKGE